MIDFSHKTKEETNMSVGEKISLIRKNENLSQEAFGEMLGVSRQAISKWESDMSVPDIDNLILISKRFGVSIGWILGIEDEQKENLSKEDISSVLEDYLIKISEMSEKHMPVPDVKNARQEKITKMVNILCWVIIGCMLLWNISLSSRLTDTNFRIDQLNNNLTSYKNQLMNEVEGMRYDIEASKGASSHVAEFSYDYVGYDPEKNEVTILISFIPQQITKDSKVIVTVNGNFDHSSTNDNSVYAEYDESAGRYFAKITVPVMQDMRISLTVDDGEMRRGSEMCKLDVYQQVSPTKTGLEYKKNEAIELKDGKIIKGDFDFFTAAPAFENTFLGHKIKTVKTELMVYHNGKFVKSIEMQDNYGKQMQIGISLPEFLKDISFKESDSLYFEVKMTDNYGREYLSNESVSMVIKGKTVDSFYNAPANDYSYYKY